MFLICIVLIVTTLVAFLTVKNERNKRYMKNIPKLELIYCIKDLLRGNEAILPNFHEYVQQRGPLVQLCLGPFIIGLLASDVKFLEHIFNSNKLIDKADQYKFVHNWLGNGLLTGTGAKWKKRRKMITPTFHFSILKNYVHVFERNANVLIKKLENELGNESFNIHELLILYALDVICESSTGSSTNAQSDKKSEYSESVNTITRIATERTFLPLPEIMYPLTPNYYAEKRALKVLHKFTNDIIEKRIKQIKEKYFDNENERVTFLDLLLRSTIDGHPLSKIDIREEVNTFIFAGHDSTATSTSFTLYEIARNPDVQVNETALEMICLYLPTFRPKLGHPQGNPSFHSSVMFVISFKNINIESLGITMDIIFNKILEEQILIFGNPQNVGVVDISQLQQMKYLEMVIKESLRLNPPFPFLGRKVKEEFEWEGNIIPSGLNLMLFPFKNMRDSGNYKNPLKFIPERFEYGDNLNPYIYVPFSAGPRNCVGQKFAMLEMKFIISKILRNFEVVPATPTHNLKLVAELVMISKNGVRIAIKKRKYQ